MKILFFPWPSDGHVNPTLAVAQELVERGEEVVYYVTDAFAAQVQSTGASVRRVDDALGPPGKWGPPAGSETDRAAESAIQHAGRWKPDWDESATGALVRMLVQRRRHRVPPLLERVRAEAADGVVSDWHNLWGWALAQHLALPTAAFFTTYVKWLSRPSAPPTGVRGARGFVPTPLQRLMSLLQMPPQQHWETLKFRAQHGLPLLRPADLLGFRTTADLNIVAMPRAFHPAGETYDERYLFAGPFLRPHDPNAEEFPFAWLDDHPLLYISRGSGLVGQPAFFAACAEAFAGSDWRVVVATGRADTTQLAPFPPNFLVRRYVPQMALLQRATAFVTHGGMNSLMEAAWHGVPVVLVPSQMEELSWFISGQAAELGPLLEMQTTATRVVELGLGRVLDPAVLDARSLREAVEAVATDPVYRVGIAALQEQMRQAGGAPCAAEAIQHLIRSHR